MSLHLNPSALLAGLIEVAKKVAPLVPYGAEGLAAGNAVLKMMADAKETVGAAPDKIAEFEATRDVLESTVNAHAKRTAESLGDG